MKKGILLFAVLAFFFSSCEKDALTETAGVDMPVKVDRLSFDSKEAFWSAMHEMSDFERSGMSSRLKSSLFSTISSLSIENDPVLSCDLREIIQTKATGVKTIYEVGNYEDLVPDERLAALLNARGEIEVGGTIYKIAEEGTYYFPKTKEKTFYKNYDVFKTKKGDRIDEMTERLADGIFRYDTFRTDRQETPEVTLTPQPKTEGLYFGQPPTPPAVPISPLALLDYGKYPRYCSDAQTWFGNLIQSIIGRNKTFDYKFSGDRRFTSKFYYYNYLFCESIGAVTKYQKKGFLGIWDKTPAKEIYIGWGNIVMVTDIKSPSLKDRLPKTPMGFQVKQKNEYNNSNEDVAYVLGLYLKQEDLDKVVGYGLKTLLSTIKSKIGQDVSGNDKICVFGPDKVYTIIPAWGKACEGEPKLNEVFYFDPTVYLSTEYFSAPSGVDEIVALVFKIIKDYLDLPHTRLVSGSIQTAVETPEGEVGAMSIYKPEKR